jgi:hypothetical protein
VENTMNLATLTTTRRSLHAVAELVLAGPQYRRHGTIRLQVTPGGFATTAGPALRVEGADLTAAGGQRWPVSGHSCATLAAAVGVQPSPLNDVYHDATGVPADEILELDVDAAGWLAHCWTVGEQALRRLAPGETPVLWPEHFDVGVRVEDTNFGVSPGDDHLAEPYAYVGPPTPRHGPFWNQPFGAARPMRAFDDAEPDSVLAFFTEGRRRIVAGD